MISLSIRRREDYSHEDGALRFGFHPSQLGITRNESQPVTKALPYGGDSGLFALAMLAHIIHVPNPKTEAVVDPLAEILSNYDRFHAMVSHLNGTYSIPATTRFNAQLSILLSSQLISQYPGVHLLTVDNTHPVDGTVSPRYQALLIEVKNGYSGIVFYDGLFYTLCGTRRKDLVGIGYDPNEEKRIITLILSTHCDHVHPFDPLFPLQGTQPQLEGEAS